MRMKRLLALILSLLLLGSVFLPAMAEDAGENDEELSEEDQKTLAEMGEGEEDDDDANGQSRSINSIVYNTPGKKYEEKTLEDLSLDSPALYTGTLIEGKSIYDGKKVNDPNKSPSEQKPTSKVLYTAKSGTTVDILSVGLNWVIVRKDQIMGYTKRSCLAKSTIKPLDPEHTPPFNEQKHSWVATTATACPVRSTMEERDDNVILTLNPGTMLSVWQFQDGWAIVNFWKTYAYIDARNLTDMFRVSPTDEPLHEDMPIAAYTSYYKLPSMQTTKEAIQRYVNRVWNIRKGCEYITVTLEPGERFDGNGLMGRYNASKGYKKAGVMSGGKTTDGYGGGTCQVSSTLYNAVIQLPGLRVTKRHPHGGDGACSYLPCQCDAAVGNESLNFCFVNDYDFTVRIEPHTSDDGALLMLIYRVFK